MVARKHVHSRQKSREMKVAANLAQEDIANFTEKATLLMDTLMQGPCFAHPAVTDTCYFPLIKNILYKYITYNFF